MAPNQPKMMLGWILKLCLVALLSNPSGVLGYSANLRGAVKTTEAEAADADADAVIVDAVSFEEVPEMEEVEVSEEEDEEEDEDEDEEEDEWEDEDEDEDFEKYILEDEDLSEEELMELREERQLHPGHDSPFGYADTITVNTNTNFFGGNTRFFQRRRPITYTWRGNAFQGVNYVQPRPVSWYDYSYLNDNNFYGYGYSGYSPYRYNYGRYNYGPYSVNYAGYWNDGW